MSQLLNPQIDTYLAEGCGRCDKWRTPACRVHAFPAVLQHLRQQILAAGLSEELKWSQPCYTHAGKNILIMSAFKDYAFVSFFQGALLRDPAGVLVQPGKNSQAARQLRYKTLQDVLALEATLTAYIQEAIQISASGRKVDFEKSPEPLPEELLAHFERQPDFQAAFEALTPGRQRGYLLHFAEAKQPQTRINRISKAMPRIFAGKGLNER